MTIFTDCRFLSKLVNVDLSHNNIVSVTERAFARLSDLKDLKLDGNKIGQITNNTFFGLTHAEVISLRSNEIAELPDQLFKFAPQLQKIDLARNRIGAIHEGAFLGLDQLKILHIEDNFLTHVPIEALQSLTALAELHLSGNPLKVIPGQAFVNFRGLVSLDLTSCRLTEVHNLAFNGLGTLKTLKLADNNLTDVPTEALRRVPNLHSLSLGQNPLTSIKRGSLSSLGFLKRLDISGCGKLASIEAEAFRGCQDLKHVTISLNRALVFINAQAFDPAMTSLHSLDLADNGLQTLPANLVPWQRLKSLDLSGNPWHCDCDLGFVASVLGHLASKANSTKVIAGQCATPEAVRGQSLHNWRQDCNDVLVEVTEDVFIAKEEKVNINAKDAIMQRHEASNATAVIVSVSIVVTVVTLTIVVFAYLKFCKHHDWIKELKWRRHDSNAFKSGPYLSGDNYIYTSPRLHHTYVYHGQSPLHTQYLQNTSSSTNTDSNTEDEYYYVSHYGQQQHCDTAVVMANGFGTMGTIGKNIPVTVL